MHYLTEYEMLFYFPLTDGKVENDLESNRLLMTEVGFSVSYFKEFLLQKQNSF